MGTAVYPIVQTVSNQGSKVYAIQDTQWVGHINLLDKLEKISEP